MPKNDIQIGRFDGMIGVAEEHDLPPGTAIYASNINMMSEDGAFVSLPEDSDTSASTSGATWFEALEDGDTVLFHNGSGTIKKILTLSGTPAVSTVGTASYASASNSCGVSDGEAVHIGLGRHATNKPQWCGNIYHDQFALDDAGGIPSGLVLEDAEILNTGVFNNSSTWGSKTTNEDEAVFFEGKTYFWYLTVVYDATQESLPLLIQTRGLANSDFTEAQYGYDSFVVNLKAMTRDDNGAGAGSAPSTATDLSRRITRVNIYRAESEGSSATSATSGLFLVKSIDINEAGWTQYTDVGEEGHTYSFTDYGSTSGDYENRTGLSPTLDHLVIHYGLNTQTESYHIVGDCWHPELKDLPNYLFRSKSYRYDTWDWASDYLVLPQRPVALRTYLGRVYAFCQGRTFVIDPNSFTIIDTWEGIGSFQDRSIAITDRGMFWADQRNIYMHDGNKVQVIGRPVLKNRYGSDYGYLSKSTDYDPLVMYDSEHDSVIILYSIGSSQLEGLMYHVETRRWVALDPQANVAIGASIHAINGSVYYHLNGTLYKLFGSGSKRSWSFVSRNLVPSLGRKTRFYHAYLHHNGTAPTLKFYEGDPDYTSATTWSGTASAGDDVTKGKINAGTWNYVRNFQIEMLAVAGTIEVNHITLINRAVAPQ